MKVVLHLRWLAYLPNLFVIALFAALAALTSPSSLADLARFLAFASAVLALSTAQRCVTVTDKGLRIRRSYLLDRFSCPWSEVVAVERRQLGPLAVDQLVLREPVRSYRRRTSGPAEVTSWPIRSKRIFIGLYDKNWRAGPIGMAMTASGVSLEATEPGGAA
ncbi:MAG TPA: hypothetical protein VN683_10370 [Acidothermaceae bacterium]|nr:hypothetical protein [Acidothermaceae bacterium]